jgi:hypothetical protein
MALADSLWATIMGAIATALVGIFSWAWQLSQRVAVLESNQATGLATAARLEAAVREVDHKVDRVVQFLLEGKRSG